MKPVLALFWKEFTHFKRDRVGVLLTFGVAFAIIYIFGNVFGNADSGGGGGNKRGVPLAVVDLSQSPSSQRLVDALEKEKSLRVWRTRKDDTGAQIPHTAESARQGIVDRHFRFALIIPENFSRTDGIGIRLKYLYNPVNEVESQIVNGMILKTVFANLPVLLVHQLKDIMSKRDEYKTYEQYTKEMAAVVSKFYDVSAEEVARTMSIDFLEEVALKIVDPPKKADTANAGGEPTSGNGPDLDELISIEKDQVIGKEVKSPQITRMIGGYAVMFLMFAVTASSASLLEEKKHGMFLRLLSMPIRPTQILWSKFLFNTALGLVQILTLFAGGALIFDVDVLSHLPNLVIFSLFAAAACSALGMLLASVSKTAAQASGFGTLVILTMSAIGGAWFPVSLMPAFMQSIAKFTLTYWAVDGFQATLWAGAPLASLLPNLGILSAIAAAFMGIAIWRFKTGDLFR